MSFRSMHRKAARKGSQAWLAVGLAGAAMLLGGCTTQYRPVVAAINPVGPAGQPTKYAYAISDPNELNTGTTLNGLITVVDFSGDSIITTPSILPRPTYLAFSASSGNGYIINQQNSLNTAALGSPLGLITSTIRQTTLPANANAPSLNTFQLGSTASVLVPETALSAVSVLTGSPPALQQQIAVPANPVYVVGNDATPRAYVLSNGVTPGQVSAIEATTLAVSANIPVGVNPVYGVETTDNRRAFVLNQGSGTVSVINVTSNAIDNANPTIDLNNVNGNGITGLQPVWADLAPQTNQLIVVSQRAGDANGYLSIVNIPLCNALAQPTNGSCDPTNPSDGAGFGQVISTVPVGINPVQVSALQDGSQAYVANRGDAAAPGGQIEGSVSVVNLVSGQVTANITGVTAYSNGTPNPVTVPTCGVTAVATAASNACVYGHPGTIAATSGTPTGKVYVTSPDSNYMTIIETDTDSVVTHVNLQGVGVKVLVSAR